MKKLVQVEIDVCDVCGIEPVAKYRTTTGGVTYCDFCGKLLCRKCMSNIDNFIVCPMCKETICAEYCKLARQATQLDKQLREVTQQIDNELQKLIDVVNAREVKINRSGQ
ncbi:MAG: hypothetical protein WC346_05090 [Methanogenium sp.]|jgi:phage FluMu protein Com